MQNLAFTKYDCPHTRSAFKKGAALILLMHFNLCRMDRFIFLLYRTTLSHSNYNMQIDFSDNYVTIFVVLGRKN